MVVLPNNQLATACGSSICIWNANDGTRVKELTAGTAHDNDNADDILSLALLNDGSLASGCRDDCIKVWKITEPTRLYRAIQTPERSGDVFALAVMASGALAACTRLRVKLWQTRTGRLNSSFSPTSTSTNRTVTYFLSMVLLPNDQLALGCSDHSIRIYSSLGKELSSVEFQEARLLAAFPNGQLAAATPRNEIRIFNISADGAFGRLARTLDGQEAQIDSLCVLPSGHLASGDAEGLVKIWETRKHGLVVQSLEAHNGQSVCFLAGLPNWTLASASGNGRVKLWNFIPENPK